MAVSTGAKSTEGATIKRFKGVASVYVRGVNPDKATLAKFYGRDLNKDPEYVGESEDNNTHIKYPQVRIGFMVEVDPNIYKDGKAVGQQKDADGKTIELKSVLSIYLVDKPYVGSRSGKHQIIDKYGRTAWATPEEIANKQIPQYKNGPANIDADYREAYTGEEDLTNFIRAYLNIPNVEKWEDGKVVGLIDNPENAECRLDHIADYFKGNVKELKDILSYQPNNKLKVLFGVKTQNDGSQVQTIYTKMFIKNNITNYSRLDENVKERKSNGAEPSTEYDVADIHEDVVTPTDFSKTNGASAPANDDPFAPNNSSATPWARQ